MVLTSHDSSSLRFMNSWDQTWCDGGFIDVCDSSVLTPHGSQCQFFDVYWTESDLLDEEKAAFARLAAERGRTLAGQFPSVLDLPYPCALCQLTSPVSAFAGHLLEAQCPRCHGRFRPTDEGMIQSLYLHSI